MRQHDMKITAVSADQLTPDHIACWSCLQRAIQDVDSPFFRPEFTLAVASVRSDIEVALLREGGEVVGFFPYQRKSRKIAGPVGGQLSDFQGIVARADVVWNPAELMRGCGLTAWDFDHVVASQELFQPYSFVFADSPFMDLADGFHSYQLERRGAGSNTIQQTMRKARKAAREVGPLRFQAHSASREVFETLIDWKSAQYRRSNKVDIFSYDWPTAILERIVHKSTDAFGGMLSVLHFGDHLAAITLYLQSHAVLHSWFPTYNPAFAKYSPGLILQVELAKLAESLGIRRIDLGRGPEPYKRSLASGSLVVAEGSVDVRPTAARLKSRWLHLRHKLLASPLRRPARSVVRAGARLFTPLNRWLSLSHDDSVWKLPHDVRTRTSSLQMRERGRARTEENGMVRQLTSNISQPTEI